MTTASRPSTAAGIDALLLHCRRIFLRGFEVPVRIGIHDFERQGAQRMLIDVDLYVPLTRTPSSTDDIGDVVDYDFIRQAVLERVARGHLNLQETLCDEILATMLARPGVLAARVSTQKPDVYPDCAGVGVEVFGINE